MLLFRFAAPELERKALDGTLTVEEVREFYSITPEMLNKTDRGTYKPTAHMYLEFWEFIMTNGARPEKIVKDISRVFHSYGLRIPLSVIKIIHRDYLDKFYFMSINQ